MPSADSHKSNVGSRRLPSGNLRVSALKRKNGETTCKDIALTKKAMRSKILLKLKTQKEEDRRKKSQSIKERLFGDSVFKRAKRVMFYISFDGEVDTEEMIKGAQNLGKIVSVPVCRRDSTLRPCMLEKGSVLKDGLYGIPEPVMKKFIRLKDLDLVITPGVAFDKKGNRLGRGRGYYDRFLKRLSPRTAAIGLAFDFQILPALPASKRDTGVSRVIFA